MNEQEGIELKKRALELLPSLKEELGDLANGVSDANLLKFLYWKTDVSRASERFRAYVTWSKENPWAFDSLEASKDGQLKKLLMDNIVIGPESLVSKDGGAVLVGRLRNNDMTDGRTPQEVCRLILYLIDRALEREEAQIHGVTIFHDLSGLGRNNVHPGIPKLLLKGILGHFPLRINGFYLLNAPWFFRTFVSTAVMTFFPKKLKQRTHFIDSLDDLHKYINKEKLLKEHGGELDFDTKAWVENQCERERNGTRETLHECIKTK